MNDEIDDRYNNVALQIKEFIAKNGCDEKGIVGILRSNFDIYNEAVGKLLMRDILLFHKNRGDIMTASIFLSPLWIINNYLSIVPGVCYPNYDIRNNYIGYTNDGIFYKKKRTSIFSTTDVLILIAFALMIIFILTILKLIEIG